SSPASPRSRLDLPAPFGPLTISASPAPSANESPATSRRPPRSSVKFSASRRITPFSRPKKRCHGPQSLYPTRKVLSITGQTFPHKSESPVASLDSFKSRKKLTVGAKTYEYFSLKAAEKNGLHGASQLPYSMKIVLENLLRNEDGRSVTKQDIEAVVGWLKHGGKADHEIAFRPARVLMQDFTGVPAVVDLAAMRDAMTALGGDPDKINPLVPVDLVIDHSVVVDYYASAKALGLNVKREYEQNQERYRFLKWGQQAFSNFSVVPPGTGICHQVNLEYLAQTVWTKKEKRGRVTVETAYPDTLVGTDSHTTMVNGLAVLGWGVGGIEAEAVMLGQPLSMLLPEVIGFKLTGELREGVTATDLVLTVTQMLRQKGVVGKFVEFYGPGLNEMSVAD